MQHHLIVIKMFFIIKIILFKRNLRKIMIKSFLVKFVGNIMLLVLYLMNKYFGQYFQTLFKLMQKKSISHLKKMLETSIDLLFQVMNMKVAVFGIKMQLKEQNMKIQILKDKIKINILFQEQLFQELNQINLSQLKNE